MNQTIKAIFENGYFKPLESLKIQIEEGQIVKLTISSKESEQNKSPSEEKNQD